MNADDQPLLDALASSQRLGMLGSLPIPDVIAHAEAFVGALADVRGVVVDLGSGGGVPGLVIAARRPDLQLVLVDRRRTRTDHLHRLVGRLDWSARVEVVTAQAAALPSVLGDSVDAVVARGFGAPPAVLTAAAPLLAGGGRLVVSEPPSGSSSRWPVDVSAWDLQIVIHDDARVIVFQRALCST
ncbi:MAG: class I SAM-dependent methyltransferase [Acidimicrobiia bacterium]|nr:class I SAM-dependent methyltransferase [Acidimicrobiia bacterium]